MRKIILLCVLAIGMMADAQTVQTIAKPLKLSTVKSGTDNDDVLVRGADKLVKSVKRNKFVSSVNNFFPDVYGNVELNIPNPEAPTLQQVLDRNSYASGRLIGVSFGTSDTPSYENFYMGAPYGFYNTKGVYGTSSYRRVELSSTNGLYLKTSSLGIGFLKFKADNLENNDVVLQSPKRSGILPISVNGNFADEDGNINIITNTATTLNDALAAGNTTTLPFYNEDNVYGFSLQNGVIPITIDSLPFKMVGSSFSGQGNEYKIGVFSWASSVGFRVSISGDTNKTLSFNLPSDKPEGIQYNIATTDDIKLKEYTVATLPTGTKGDVAFVNDAASPAFLATVVGGGSAVVRVFYNGSNWIVQ